MTHHQIKSVLLQDENPLVAISGYSIKISTRQVFELLRLKFKINY